MNALDLFCCEGGTSKGLSNQGCKVTGVDIEKKEEYHYKFIQADALSLSIEFLRKFDFIWASPPCQRYSVGGNTESRKKYPDLIADTRKMLDKAGVPYVIENVPGAPIRKDLMLCGEMFGLKVIRHRYFEISGFKCKQPKKVCKNHKGKVISGEYHMVCTGGRPGCFGDNKKRRKLTVGSIQDWQNAMGISHITSRKGLAESIPPAYSEYIVAQFKEYKKEVAGSEADSDNNIPPNPKGSGILPKIL